MLRVLYFATVKERMGRESEALARPPGVRTVGALAGHLRDRDAAGARAFADLAAIRAAVNLDFATPDTPLGEDDEVAFFPPVTGG